MKSISVCGIEESYFFEGGVYTWFSDQENIHRSLLVEYKCFECVEGFSGSPLISAEQAEQLVLNTSLGPREDTSCYASNEDDDDEDNGGGEEDDDEETTREDVKQRDQLSNISSQKLRRKLEHLNFSQVKLEHGT
jgi:hypothetical protein